MQRSKLKEETPTDPDLSTASLWMQDALRLADEVIAAGEGDLTAMGEFPDVEYKVCRMFLSCSGCRTSWVTAHGKTSKLNMVYRWTRYIRARTLRCNSRNRHHAISTVSLLPFPTISAIAIAVVSARARAAMQRRSRMIQICQTSPRSYPPLRPAQVRQHHVIAIPSTCSAHWPVPTRPAFPKRQSLLLPPSSPPIWASRPVPRRPRRADHSKWALHPVVRWQRGRHRDGRARFDECNAMSLGWKTRIR